jgi:hypothetical protein
MAEAKAGEYAEPQGLSEPRPQGEDTSAPDHSAMER